MAANQQHNDRSRGGQAIIFAILVLVVLFFVVLWSFDLHKIVGIKMRSQNAGDAAAVVAARWQGITLNLMGDLNILRAGALSVSDRSALDAIDQMQARLAFVGPMIAFEAAQQAAKNNGIFQNEDMTQLVREHADRVRNDYTQIVGPNGEMLFPEPFTDAWTVYADMLDFIADEGVAAGPENARYYTDFDGNHLLLMQAFYDAVAGRIWCWFYNHAYDALLNFTDYTWWPELGITPRAQYVNSEIFSLGLRRQTTTMSSFARHRTLVEIAAERNLNVPLNSHGLTRTATWYCYGPEWGPWTALSQEVDDPFPSTGELRPEYDYAGADAAVRVEAAASRLTPTSGGGSITNVITWTAAAKPFGYFEPEPDERIPPTAHRIVLPAFRDARLIAIDASSTPSGGGYSVDWRRHIETHLPLYVATGNLPSPCWYCQQIIQWENPLFRQGGVTWLNQNSRQCIPSGGGGGGGGGGGRRIGH